MCLCISECTCPSVCEKFYFKRMVIFSLNGQVHFLFWLYTSSALSIQNIDINNVLFLSSLQFLFIVSAVVAVVYCYHRSAECVCECECECDGVCNMCIRVCVYVCVYMLITSVSFTYEFVYIIVVLVVLLFINFYLVSDSFFCCCRFLKLNFISPLPLQSPFFWCFF